ncbi:hypothetical protein K0M31_008131 [Melipona bicolor]|uniref:Uncharacterized protein n=1 Tax=Melipona bicolor TaxID=60889 RepID=A0AA40FQD1_9HYME|nr:hypothetical protein K0M31_008131 [Melipona bicolor]
MFLGGVGALPGERPAPAVTLAVLLGGDLEVIMLSGVGGPEVPRRNASDALVTLCSVVVGKNRTRARGRPRLQALSPYQCASALRVTVKSTPHAHCTPTTQSAADSTTRTVACALHSMRGVRNRGRPSAPAQYALRSVPRRPPCTEGHTCRQDCA